MNNRQAKLLRQLSPCWLGCVHDLQHIRMFRDGDDISEWISWWAEHAKGLYPVLRTYPTVWIKPYMKLVLTLRSNLRLGREDKLGQLPARVAELALTGQAGPQLQAEVWAVVAPEVSPSGRAGILSAAELLAFGLRAAESADREAKRKNSPLPVPQVGSAKRRKKKRKGVSPNFWNLTHPLSGSYEGGKRR